MVNDKNMKKIKLFILVSVLFTGTVNAQQEAQYTQYVLNHYVLNPATGGVNNFWDIKTGFRSQWTGLESSPKTFFVSGHGAIGYPHGKNRQGSKKPHHGIGGYAFYDKTGPISWAGAYGSYAYHLKLTNDLSASLGAFVGIKQTTLRGADLVFVQNPNDPTVTQENFTKIVPDAAVGFWLYSSKMFFGASINQLLQNKIGLGNESITNTLTGKLNNHYFIIGGYKIKLNAEFDFIPSLMVKYVQPAPVQFDINTRIRYKDFLWGGISYRHQDAIAIFAGVLIQNNFEIGYAYDLTTSALNKYSGGSHEIILGTRLPFYSKRIHCPNDFWD